MDELMQELLKALTQSRNDLEGVEALPDETNVIGLEYNGELYFLKVQPA